MTLELERNDSESLVRIAARGRIDATSSALLLAEVETLQSSRPPQLALDLAGVEYLSSAGLRVLLSALKTVRRWQGKVQLIAPRPEVESVLAGAGFERLFEILRSPDPS